MTIKLYGLEKDEKNSAKINSSYLGKNTIDFKTLCKTNFYTDQVNKT